MKLLIGETIRNYRKKNDLTQEQLADRLGVTYQSISRWENGTTYPDLELLPAISEVLSVTVDELLGMPQAEKEKKAEEAFDQLRRECMKQEYDADRIVSILRDIRRNYLKSNSAWRPWTEGNDRAFRDPKILPEVRLLAEAYLQLHPTDVHTIQTMAYSEDEEHLHAFLKTHTTAFDCSQRMLLFDRYCRRGTAEELEPERRFQLYRSLDNLFSLRYLIPWEADTEHCHAANPFMRSLLSIVRRDAADDRPDMWVSTRLELGFQHAKELASNGKTNEALAEIEAAVHLLEQTMRITDEVLLPTSCRFLDGMEWTAKEDWHSPNNDPDGPKERFIFISTRMDGMCTCNCLYPSAYDPILGQKEFDALRETPELIALRNRIQALIVTKEDPQG